jgi:hypothetical protein
VPFSGQAQTCNCDVSARKIRAYDELLRLDDGKLTEALAIHLPLGTPLSPPNATNEHLLGQDDCVINYDDDLRIPLWVSER